MSRQSSKNLERAISLLNKKDFKNARSLFSLAYRDDSTSLDAKVGILLTSLPENLENEIVSLYEFYNVMKSFDKESSYEMIESLCDSFENAEIDLLENIYNTHAYIEEFGISYEDLKDILKNEKDKKKVLQAVFFSTKLLIDNKDDFFDFVDLLVEYGYKELAIGYIDYATNFFPNDEKLSQLAQKLRYLETINGHR